MIFEHPGLDRLEEIEEMRAAYEADRGDELADREYQRHLDETGGDLGEFVADNPAVEERWLSDAELNR